MERTVELRDGVKMPLFGLGMYLSEPGTNTAKAVEYALKHGYRMLDTAQCYKNEDDVREGIKLSGLKREDVFIVTKIMQHGRDETIKSVNESLKRLGTSYVDLFLIHWPQGGRNVETYKALLELKEQGKIRSVGVSNFGIQHLKGLAESGLPTPSVNQIELHPFMKREELVKYCRDQGIVVMGFSPLARSKRNDDPDLIRISKKLNKTVAQVMIRWSLDKDYITIPKTTNPQRIVENANVFDFKLPQEDIKILDSKPDDLNAGENNWNPVVLPWEG